MYRRNRQPLGISTCHSRNCKAPSVVQGQAHCGAMGLWRSVPGKHWLKHAFLLVWQCASSQTKGFMCLLVPVVELQQHQNHFKSVICTCWCQKLVARVMHAF
eukprot:415453-Pelagomonas_calceolata.AAC.3